jgi:TetR/AcrR family transcriptional regulator
MDQPYETLPRGRHGLSREQVRDSQRSRLLLGMAESVAEKGYLRTTIADVLKRVRVSRETFYQHFADKEACFLAVLDTSAHLLAGLLPTDDGARDEPMLDRFERVITAYFGALADQASFARVFFVESFAAGPRAQRKRVEVQERFIDLMIATFEGAPEWQAIPDPRFTCRVLVGGISSLVSAAVITGETDHLCALAPQVIDLVRRLIG